MNNMEKYNDFLIDLRVSKYVDKYVIEKIIPNYESFKIIENNDKKYDYLLINEEKTIKLEIKTDYIMYFTNNFAFEVISKNKVGCVFYSESDYYLVYDYFDEKIYVFYTKKLKDFFSKIYENSDNYDEILIEFMILNDLEKRIYEKNDNQFVVLVDKDKWLDFFKRYNIIKKIIKIKKIKDEEFINFFEEKYINYKIIKQKSKIYEKYKDEIIKLLKK